MRSAPFKNGLTCWTDNWTLDFRYILHRETMEIMITFTGITQRRPFSIGPLVIERSTTRNVIEQVDISLAAILADRKNLLLYAIDLKHIIRDFQAAYEESANAYLAVQLLNHIKTL